jgi:hypothetical protein
MALTVIPNPRSTRAGGSSFVYPGSIASDWVDICTAPNVQDGASNGDIIVNPSLITRSAQNKLAIDGTTALQVRLKYPTLDTISTAPIVQIFGFDKNDLPQRLLDSTGTHALTLAASAANDAVLSTWSYGEPVEVDTQANVAVLVAVKTKLVGSTTSTIQARVK